MSGRIYTDQHDLIVVAVYGFIMVTGAFIVVYIFDSTHPMLETIFSITGAVLNLAGGILVLTGHHGGSNTYLLVAILMIVAGVLMLLDFVRLVKK